MRWAALLAGLVAPPAEAACRLALLLALDVSSSVDDREYALQSQGLAAALDAPEVRHAILSGGGEVALAVYEWSGRDRERLHLDWTLLRSHADITRAVAALAGWSGRPRNFPPRWGPRSATARR